MSSSNTLRISKPDSMFCQPPSPSICHLAWMRAAVACGLASSSGAGTPWVRRHRVPETLLLFFVIKSPADFVVGLDQDFLLLPVRMLRKYPNRITSYIVCY